MCIRTRRTQFQDTKFPLPKVRLERELDWVTDEEFGRQMLAGESSCLQHAQCVKLRFFCGFPDRWRGAHCHCEARPGSMHARPLALSPLHLHVPHQQGCCLLQSSSGVCQYACC